MQHSENDKDEEERMSETGEGLIKDISSNICLLFNNLIYLVSKQRKNLIKQSPNQFATVTQPEPETPAKKQSGQQKIFEQEVKEIHKLYKIKENKLQNKPKKPVSSFFVYYQQNSRELAARYGETLGSKIAQRVAEQWKQLTQEQKQPYNDKANDTKEKYRQQMSKYIQQHADEIEQIKQLKRIKNNKMRQLNKKIKGSEEKEEVNDEQDNDTSQLKGISIRQMKAEERKKYAHRPKAPVSSFFIFYQDQAKNIATKFGQTVGSKIAKLASDVWKNMSKIEKEKYEDRAKLQRLRYHQQMLQYRIDYPNQIENRRKKISEKMKRFQKLQAESNGLSKEEISSNNSDSNSNIQQNNQDSSDSYISSAEEEEKDHSDIKEEEKQSKIQYSSQTNPLRKQQKQLKISSHKPKGPICSFFQYYHLNFREFMKRENEDGQKDPGSEFVRRASTKWNSLTEEQRQPFHELAKIDRERYKTEMQQFKIEYPEQYQSMQEATKMKQLSNKKKRQDTKINLQDIEVDQILLENE